MAVGHNGEGGVSVMVLHCAINECSVCVLPWIEAGHNGESGVSVMDLYCTINEYSVCVPQ